MLKHVVAAAAAAFLMVPALARAQSVDILQPPARVGVPWSGASVPVTYAAEMTISPLILPCGIEYHTWHRDNAAQQTCTGRGCEVTYNESAATRGTHVASDSMLAYFFAGGSCSPTADSDSQSYIVQYLPVATIVSMPTQLRYNRLGSFAGQGTVDTQYSANGAPLYRWDWGDGTYDLTANASHAWQYGGDYVIAFTVSDGALSHRLTRDLHIVGPEQCGNTYC